MPYTVHLAGTSVRSAQIAQAIIGDVRFALMCCITPAPRPVGRKQTLTACPLASFASENQIPSLEVGKKIDESIRTAYESLIPPDILLVVDFGFFVPSWMLARATIAPVNIHPSHLPKYRGSSPGQFALLFGEKTSAVTVMQMDEKMDHGPIITTIPLKIESDWTQQDYYAHAFARASAQITDILADFCQTPHSTPQPDDSPTPTARLLSRDDGYVPFETLQELLDGKKSVSTPIKLLSQYELETSPKNLYNMWRALHPWPSIWTLMPVKGQQKRVKLLSFSYKNETLVLETIQIEGEKEKVYRY